MDKVMNLGRLDGIYLSVLSLLKPLGLINSNFEGQWVSFESDW